jgi:hypothetical protein
MKNIANVGQKRLSAGIVGDNDEKHRYLSPSGPHRPISDEKHR